MMNDERRTMNDERPNSPVDPWLLFVVVSLVMVGLIQVYASTYHLGLEYLSGQLVRVGAGLVALVVGCRFSHRVLASKFRWPLVVLALLALAATFVLGHSVGVAKRWLGFIQPSEIAKFVLPLWLAAHFAELKGSTEKPRAKSQVARHQPRRVAGSKFQVSSSWNLSPVRRFVRWVLVPAVVVFAFLGLVLRQPAIGTTVIMAVSTMALLSVVGIKLKYLALAGAAAGVLVGVVVLSTPYAQKRLADFSSGDRYQQEQSLLGVGSGGLFGRGLGEGRQKFYFLPKLHTDFIFASIGEEFGFVGSVGVLLLYGLLLVRGFIVGGRTSSHFGQYLASGIAVTIFIYALVHIAVVLGILPPTGQPLPFVSFGGSAIVTNLFAAGVLLNISRFQRRGPSARIGSLVRMRVDSTGRHPESSYFVLRSSYFLGRRADEARDGRRRDRWARVSWARTRG